MDPVKSNKSGRHDVFDWVYLELPELKAGAAERSFRSKWLTPRLDTNGGDPVYSTDMFTQVGAALEAFGELGRPFPFSPDEEALIAINIERFVESFVARSTSFHFGIGTTIRRMGLMATHVAMSEEIAANLRAKVDIFLEQSEGAPDPFLKTLFDARIAIGFALIPGLIKSQPDDIEDFIQWLSAGMMSQDQSRILGAKSAIQCWISAAMKGYIVNIPNDFIREIGTIIPAGRGVNLGAALACAVDVFDRGTDTQRDTMAAHAERGLTRLSEILGYEGEQDPDTKRFTHTLRLLCVQLAIAMTRQGHQHGEGVIKWLEIGRIDPYPEPRNEVVDLQTGR